MKLGGSHPVLDNMKTGNSNEMLLFIVCSNKLFRLSTLFKKMVQRESQPVKTKSKTFKKRKCQISKQNKCKKAEWEQARKIHFNLFSN